MICWSFGNAGGVFSFESLKGASAVLITNVASE